MSLKSKLFSFLTLVFAVTAFSAAASAQETTTTPEAKTEKTERKGFGKGGSHGGFGKGVGLHALRGIELTDAQKEQIRAVMNANKPSQETLEETRTLIQAKRNGTNTPEQTERLQVLKRAAREKALAVNTQVQNILTDEQKQQVEQKKQEMRQRLEQRRQLREQKKAEQVKPVEN